MFFTISVSSSKALLIFGGKPAGVWNICQLQKMELSHTFLKYFTKTDKVESDSHRDKVVRNKSV